MTSERVRPPRAAVYARQSVDQDEGIAQQLVDCRHEAERRGWPVVLDDFYDNDTSGSKERGPKTDWAKMLRAFDEGLFDTLIVTETSRLTRSLADVLQVRPPIRDMRVIVIRQGIDTDVDDFLLLQLVLLARQEVKIKAQRDARYAVERRAAGHPTAGQTPHGYRWVPAALRDEAGTRYVIDEDEAQDVRRIFSEYLAGASLGQIARDLTDAGRRTRRGARWHSSTVRRILMNPLYAAMLPPAQPTGEFNLAAIDLHACVQGAWEPIIERDQILATHGRLVRVKPIHNGTARRWLLSGIAVCSVCRKPVRSARGITHPTARRSDGTKAPSKSYHSYRCVEGHFHRNGEVIDEFVEEVCIARLAEPDAASAFPSPNTAVDVVQLHVRRTAAQSQRDALIAMVADGTITQDEATSQLQAKRAELEQVDEELARAGQRHPLADLIGVEDVRSWWEERTLARKRSIIELLMDEIAIRPIGYGRKPKSPEEVLASLEIRPRKMG